MGQTRRKGNESVCSLVLGRQHGKVNAGPFERGVSQVFKEKQYLKDFEIVSPHRKAVSCMSLDEGAGRFLLAGSADATISVYDTSKWGSEYFMRNGDPKASKHSFHPVARSMKVPATEGFETPGGHSFSLSHVQWYPVDTGAFLSTSIDGCILLWDTNQMQPVLRVQPFEDSTGGCAHLQTGGDHSLIATGSSNDAALKLVDVKSGAHSHQLTGHDDGISNVQWSPTNPLVLASGSRDGTIRLWDIRKSGSRACITILDREAPPPIDIKSYAGDYSHLRESFRTKKSKKKRVIGPNNYDYVQNGAGGRSHSGYVAGLQFFPDGQSLASIGGPDGELSLWDLRLGVMVPSKFVAPGGVPACTPRKRRAALCVESDGSMIWVGHKSNLLGFSVEGGSPTQVLQGHLHNICSVNRMDPIRNLLSGSQDGMILCWGRRNITESLRKKPLRTEDCDNW